MKFIELTGFNDEKWYFNAQNISAFCPREDGYIGVYTVGDPNPFTVKETWEEINKLLTE